MPAINVYGDIFQGAEEWGGVSAKWFKEQIEALEGDEVAVNIHSRGGDVFEGFLIYDALIASGKKVKTVVDGLAASIASVIFMAGGEREIAENGEIMIHNPTTFAEGDKEDMEKVAERLQAFEEKAIKVYQTGTNLSDKDLDDLMKEETWMNAEEAVEKGFATAKMERIEALAYVKPEKVNNNNIVMKGIKKLSAKLDDAIKMFAPEPKIMTVKLQEGGEIIVKGEELAEGSELSRMQDEQEVVLENGDYTLEDGKVIKVEDGKVSSIEEPVAEEVIEQKIDQLVDELKTSKEQNEALKDQVTQLAKGVQSHGQPPGAPGMSLMGQFGGAKLETKSDARLRYEEAKKRREDNARNRTKIFSRF